MLQFSPPPSYATATSNETSAPGYHEITERAPGFQYLQRTPRGIMVFDASNASEPRYRMAEYHDMDRSSIVLYRGSGRIHPALGEATFSHAGVDFIIAVDGPTASPVAAPELPEQEVVTCINNYTHFGTHSYRFAVPGRSDSGENQAQTRSLIWRHTHKAKLRSAVWRPKDLTLIKEASNQVVAVYIHISETKNVAGRLEWRAPCSFDEKTRALVVLAVFLERIRRSRRLGLNLPGHS